MIIDLEKEELTINQALFIAKENDVLILGNKTYNEQVIVTTKNLTFKGSTNTIISNNYHNGLIINGNKLGTTTSATFLIKEEAINTKILDITFVNSHVVSKDTNNQAVAFKSEASNTIIDNCKFLSNQDTLYMDFGFNNVIKNSYVEGDIDFIFGSADCFFINCKINTVNNNRNAYFTAPSTIVFNNYGFVFYKCEFNTSYPCYIGRRWYPSKAESPVYPRLTIIDSKLNGNINLDFIKMTESNPEYYEFKINNCYLNDKLVGNDDVKEELKHIKELF